MPLLASPRPVITGGPARPPGESPRHTFELVLGPAGGGYEQPLPQATNVSFTWRLTDAHEGSFTVNALAGYDSMITDMATDLHVFYAGQHLLRGRIGSPADDLDGSGHLVTYTAESYLGLLDRRMFYSDSTLTWANADIGLIVVGMLAQTQRRPGGDLGIAPGAGIPYGQKADKTVSPGDLIAEKIDDLAYADPNGFDWDVTPADAFTQTLDLWPVARGADRGVMLQYGDALTSTPWQRSLDTSTFANALIEQGGNSTTAVELAAADIASTPQGRWDTLISVDETDQKLLQARAKLQLAASRRLIPSYTIPLRPGIWGGPSHIWIGDTVRVRVGSGRLTGVETLRVLELTANLTQDGSQVTLTVGTPAPKLHRALRQLIRELRRARKHRAAGRSTRPA